MLFPDFKNSCCVSLTACGEIKTANKSLAKLLNAGKAGKNDLISKGEKIVTRLVLGGKSGKHFHVAVFPASRPTKETKSEKSLTADQIQTKIEPLIGNEIITDLRGGF